MKHTEDYDETRAAAASVTQEYKRTFKNLGALKGRTMTDKIDTTPEAVTLLPRPDKASTWTLDPEFVANVAHGIQRNEGWDATMEATELAMLAAEKHILELFPIPAMLARIAELEAKLAKAVNETEDYKDCLNSWFDTKKLAEDQIDPKIIAAASGYLLTSRSGGMSDNESDMVLSVIKDMSFRGVFSTIFTQFTLAEIKGETT